MAMLLHFFSIIVTGLQHRPRPVGGFNGLWLGCRGWGCGGLASITRYGHSRLLACMAGFEAIEVYYFPAPPSMASILLNSVHNI